MNFLNMKLEHLKNPIITLRRSPVLSLRQIQRSASSSKLTTSLSNSTGRKPLKSNLPNWQNVFVHGSELQLEDVKYGCF